MSDYMKMVRESVKSGANQDVMWHAVEVADNLLCDIKESHPDLYDEYMRKMSAAIFGCHYTEDLAKADVDKMFHTDTTGKKIMGPHWNADQVEQVWSAKKFPTGTNKWDKFVAANAFWHDLSNEFEDDEILEIAHSIFFADEDSDNNGKVWKYMNMNMK